MSTQTHKIFLEAVDQLLKEDEVLDPVNDPAFSNLDQPTEYTPEQQEAINKFNEHLDQLNNGLITRKEFIDKVVVLYDALPDWDWLKK